MDELKAKSRDYASYSIKPLTAREIDRVIELVTNLEEIPNVSQIIRLLSQLPLAQGRIILGRCADEISI